MSHPNKSRKKGQVQPDSATQVSQEEKDSTSNMHYIVVHNKRNAWLDDQYETPMDVTKMPIFH